MSDINAVVPSPCIVVIPCFNEELRLNMTAFSLYLESNFLTNFLFVNDGSTDNTNHLLQTLQLRFPDRVSILDLKINGGKAEAVRAGLLHIVGASSESILGFWDADLATPLSSILEMKSVFERRPQVMMVFGARVRLLGRHIQRQPMRHYLGRVFATAVSVLLGIPIYDTQCGAKLFRNTPDFKKSLARPFTSRWIFDVELLSRFLALHKNEPMYASTAIYEYSLDEWEDVAGSRLRPLDFFKAIAELLQIRLMSRR